MEVRLRGKHSCGGMVWERREWAGTEARAAVYGDKIGAEGRQSQDGDIDIGRCSERRNGRQDTSRQLVRPSATRVGVVDGDSPFDCELASGGLPSVLQHR